MKHNKWYIKNGVIDKIYITKPGASKSLRNSTVIKVKKIEAIMMPEGSSDCLYIRDAIFRNLAFFILVTKGFLFFIKQIKGAAIYAYPIRDRKTAAFPSKLNVITQTARRATAAESKILTLLRVQKPDFSTTEELGNLLLKYAIAFFLLASSLGFFSKLVVNIGTYLHNFAFYSGCNINSNFNIKNQMGES